MSKIKTLIALIIVISMLALLVSCNNTASDTSKDNASTDPTSQAEQSETSEDEEYVLFSNLPDKNYGGDTITFLVTGDYQAIYYSQEIMPHDSSPELISDAVSERNSLVEEKFGVKIAEIRTASDGEMVTLIRANAQASPSLYDVVCPYIPSASALSLENIFYNLYTLDNIHLDMPYWDQTAVEDMSIANKLYFCTGDMSLLTLGCTHAIVFNKSFVEDGRVEDLYNIVESGEWTYDKLYELGKSVTADSDGVTGMTSTDTYGFILNQNFPTSMYLGSGNKLIGKDTNDMPLLALGSSTSADIVSKLVNIINDASCCAAIESFSDYSLRGKNNVWELATAMVAEGNTLFRAVAIIDVPDLGAYDCSFGLLPTPKYTVEQENYYSNVSVVYATAYAIPTSNASRVEEVSIILDALMQASTDTTKYAYYEQLLKGRRIQDPESEAVLDDIFGHRVYDLGIVYAWGGVNNVINTVVWSGSNTFSSSLDSIEDAVKTQMESTISFMK